MDAMRPVALLRLQNPCLWAGRVEKPAGQILARPEGCGVLKQSSIDEPLN